VLKTSPRTPVQHRGTHSICIAICILKYRIFKARNRFSSLIKGDPVRLLYHKLLAPLPLPSFLLFSMKFAVFIVCLQGLLPLLTFAYTVPPTGLHLPLLRNTPPVSSKNSETRDIASLAKAAGCIRAKYSYGNIEDCRGGDEVSVVETSHRPTSLKRETHTAGIALLDSVR
jgi:hypothetical protein